MPTACPRLFFSASAGAGRAGESTPAARKPLCLASWLLPVGDAEEPPIVSNAATPASRTRTSSASSARRSTRERIYREVSSARAVRRLLLAAVRRQAHLHTSQRDANCEQT